ncbi:MAG: EAL domain-containing protein [Chloroflexi bacterium]|nr:EAL domain-containing protein [Chloroflexota bacterium]
MDDNQELQHWFQAALDKMPDGVALVIDGRIEYSNGSFSELMHLNGGDGSEINIIDIFHSDDQPEAGQLISEILAGGPEYPIRVRLVGKAEKEISVEFFARQISYGDASAGLICIFRDLTVEQRFEEALGEVEERYRTLVENAPEAIVVYDANTGRFVDANEKAVWLFGLEREAIFRVGFVELSAEYQSQGESFLKVLQEQIQRTIEGEVVEFEWVCLGAGGKEIPCEVRLVQLPATDRNLVRCSLLDITERKHIEEQLVHEALYDSLTGLPNRMLIMDRIELSVRRALTEVDYSFAVLFLDIDRFKKVNDSLGHVAGDQLLIKIAQRLEASVGPGDLVARFAGDEFTILLDEIRTEEYAVKVSEDILAQLGQPFELSGQEIFVSASIGIIYSSVGYNNPENLIKDADTAMYIAKGKGKARYEVFDPQIHSRAVDLLQLEIELRRALENKEFELHYEPIVSVGNRKVTGLEAFIRWQHPERGLVLPDQFIKHAEEIGIIGDIDEWVLRTACNQFHAWQDLALPPPRIAINLSSHQIRRKNLKSQVEEIIKAAGLSPSWIELELLETVLLDDIDEAVAAIQELKSVGVRLSLDDFGAVYSSLSQLRHLPIDILRIDRTLIAEVVNDRSSAAIVSAIISLAKSLDLKVVAEGVETEEQLEFLRQKDCDEAQGYLFGHPLPVDQITELLLRGSSS